MKALEIFDRFLREGLISECCGIVHGSDVNHLNPMNYFGCKDDSLVLRANWDYLYYYGESGLSLSFMPFPDVNLGLCENGCFLYLWVLE